MKKEELLDHINYLEEITKQTRIRAADGYQYFLLWGVLWIIGYLGSIYYPDIIWSIITPIGGIASLLIGYRMNRNKQKPLLLKKIGWLALILLLSAIIISILLSQIIEEPSLLGQIFNSYWPFWIGIIYLSAGIFMDKIMVRIGSGLLLISLIGFFLPNIYQEIWFAILGGGGIILTGLILRKQVLKNE